MTVRAVFALTTLLSSFMAAFVVPAASEIFDEVRLRYAGASGTNGYSLVVANSVYSNATQLAAPERDAEFVAGALTSRGIDVKLERNLSPDQIVNAIRSFSNAARKELFIFYYAGHAAQFGNDDRLITKDFEFGSRSADASTLSLDLVISEIGRLGFKRILIAFDACRDLVDPRLAFAEQDSARPPSSIATRGLSFGGVDIETIAETDSAISFSAGEGQVAIDAGPQGISPYAEAFGQGFRNATSVVDFVLGLRADVKRSTSRADLDLIESFGIPSRANL